MYHRFNNLTTTGNIRPWAWTTVSDRLAIFHRLWNFELRQKSEPVLIVRRTNVPLRVLAVVIVAQTGQGVLQPRQGGREVFAFEAGCRRIAAGCHRTWGGPVPARHAYSRFKDVSETVLTRKPAALTHSYTVLERSTDGQSRLWDASWRLSRGQGTLANGCRTPTHGCEAVVMWSCRVFKKPRVTASDFHCLFTIKTQYIGIEKKIMPPKKPCMIPVTFQYKHIPSSNLRNIQ